MKKNILIGSVVLFIFVVGLSLVFINKKLVIRDVEQIHYFGNEAYGDLNGDNLDDTVFLFTKKNKENISYYVAVSLPTPTGHIESQAFFLGDNIAPQANSIGTPVNPKTIIINYAVNNIGKSVYLLLDPKTLQLGEVVQNFEGEANPSVMTLDQKKWVWVKNQKFTLTFKKPNTFSATTDCNGVGGEYTQKGNNITFTKMMSTLMYCEGSQESEFSKALSEIQSYHFTSKGELVFDLKSNTASMVFK